LGTEDAGRQPAPPGDPVRAPAWPTSATRVAGIIGDPVRHSLSPVLHNAAFAALGLDWAYLAFPVSEGGVAPAITGMRALGIEGLSVTMPHKSAAASAVGRLTPTAARLGAVNTVLRRRGDLVGDSTDGEGLVQALAHDEGWQPAGRRCLVLGAGGAARAVVLALAEAGSAEVVVVGRRPDMAAAAAGLAGAAGRPGSIEMIDRAELIVNATPVGMAGVVQLDGRVEATLPFDLGAERLGPGQMVVDLVYAPSVTPLLEAARGRGAVGVNGLGMLIHQAALQIRLWTGEDPPLEVMSAAALATLAQRGDGPRP
jgi:shikimate dehydrogenase